MKESEAVRIVGLLGAAFNRELAEDTVAVWARQLTDCEIEDAMEAISVVVTAGRFVPSLAEFKEYIRDCRNTRLREERALLPKPAAPRGITFTEFLLENPEMRERVEALEENGESRAWDGNRARSLMSVTLANFVQGELRK